MVSPSKIFKSSNAGYKVGISISKTDCLKTHGDPRQRTLCQTKKFLPLVNTKFFLDIRNKSTFAEVESTLKSNGARIELFFKKGVKIVVTDKTEWMRKSPATSTSPLTTPSPSNKDQRFVLPKTRASAMLEKVLQQPTPPFSSVLELAQLWGIRILHVSSLWKWIAEVEERKLKKGKEIKIVSYARESPFIKVESSVSPNTPEFLVLGSWPRLNLEGHLGQCPFRSPSTLCPSVSEEESKEVENKLFEVKDKVTVEVIKYDTDFRINNNFKIGECELEPEETDFSRKQVIDFEDLHRLKVTINNRSKMTRRPVKSNSVASEDETISEFRQNLSPLCNGYSNRNITRQSSHELLKVQCNGLTTSHRNSKLLSPSGSDVLPLPTSRRTTRRTSASWCGSTRELSQLSPTDSEIENIRRSESSFETPESPLDSPGITLRPKGQLWLPVALIGTTAEENGNCIRKRYEYSLRHLRENLKHPDDLLETVNEKVQEIEDHSLLPSASKESDSSLSSNCSSNDYQIKRNIDKKDTYCIITRNTKMKNCEINGRSRESSIESHVSEQMQMKNRTETKKRAFSVCGRASPAVKRARTMSANSINTVGRKKKLSPEEKLLQDNREYFKMEVLNTKLRSSGSLLNVNLSKDVELNAENSKPEEKIEKIIIKKIKIRGKRKKSRWTKASTKKGNDLNYATVIVENKRNNLKINGVIKRKRQSELMKLCNEAETFMFGESSRQGNTPAVVEESEMENPSRKKGNSTPRNRVSTKENSYKGNRCRIKTRRKRRSHAEAFIHDNLDYYKFETPGSRLRYQGNFLDVKSEDKDFIYTLRQKRKERLSTEQNKKNELLERLQFSMDIKEERLENQEKKKNVFKPSEEMEKILFSFESVPQTEPWYAVYKRQDEGMENYYPLLSDPNDQPFLLPYELPKPNYPKVPAVCEYYNKKRKKFVNLFNHPRKSPRCHASTLAILSSLKKRKRRSGTNISINSTLTESPPSNCNSSSDKADLKLSEGDTNEFISEDVLNLFFKSESDGEIEEIFLEPFSDSEITPKRRNSDSNKSVKSDDEDQKNQKTGSRSKKVSKVESQNECESLNDEEKHFSMHSIDSDFFVKDLVIEVKKKSGLNLNIASVLENFRDCKSMEEADAALISDVKGGVKVEVQEGRGRRRRKARKINKTGWDNRKSRRKAGIKLADTKEAGSEEVKPSLVKAKVRSSKSYISSENIILNSNRRMRRGENIRHSATEERKVESEGKPVLRSHTEGLEKIRRLSQDSESVTESLDTGPRDLHTPCVVRLRKLANPNINPSLRLGCSRGRYSVQKRLVLSRKKKRVIDYAWTTRRRR